MNVSIKWATPTADNFLAYLARVSNPKAKLDDEPDRLIGYLIKNKHWSPFDMVNMCVEISTSRDIARQIMRHWSLLFHDLKVQEFSQRYADVQVLGNPVIREARLQDSKNRQNSLHTDDVDLQLWWKEVQEDVWKRAIGTYAFGLERGLAKEQARAVLPEGITPTKFLLNGTARQWIHYLDLRTDPGTQLEHREVATGLGLLFANWAPATAAAASRMSTDRRLAAANVTSLIETLETGRPITAESMLRMLKSIKEAVS